MKTLLRLITACAVLTLITKTALARTFDWKGSSSTAWNNAANWTRSGSGGTSTWPGQSGTADVVRIGVTAYTVRQPTLSTGSITVASIEFGDNGGNNMTLTVNGFTLSVTGTIKQDFIDGYIVFIFPVSQNLTTTLTGTGTISCQNFTLGDGSQPTVLTNNVTTVSSQINQLTITNDLTLAAEGDNDNIFGSYSDVNYPVFSVDKNKVTINGQIVTSSSDNPGTTSVDGHNGAGLFIADTGTGNTTVELTSASAIATPVADNFAIDFTYGGSGTGTVLYDSPSGSQKIYTGNTAGVATGDIYDCLALSNAGTKNVQGGALTMTHDLTTTGGTVNLSINNPSVTLGGNWTNSTTVTNGSGTVTCTGDFTNNTGGNFNCSSGDIFLNGDYTNNANFSASTGTVYFNNAGTQTLTDNSISGTTFNNVTVENSGIKTLTGSGGFYVSSTSALTMGGTAQLAAAGLLTLRSDASGSATVAAIPVLAKITGNVNVQRYVTGGALKYRGYRLMSSPVYNGTDPLLNHCYSINYLKNSMYVTGTTTTGGFDNASPANPSLYLYRENMTPGYLSFTASNYRGINTINNSPAYKYTLDVDGAGYYIPSGNGFLCWFRGNRASASYAAQTVTTYVPQSATLSTAGVLNQQSVIVHNWFTPSLATLSATLLSPASGFNLVGNPYASSIDWETFQSTVPTSGIYGLAIGNTMYVLDPQSHNYGSYVKGGGGLGTNHASNIISSGQGFFVVASSSLAQVIFNESAKTSTQAIAGSTLLMGKPLDQSANAQYLRLQLAKDSVNTDDIVLRFNSAAKTTFDPNVDAPYKPGYGVVSLSSRSSDNVDLAINMRPIPAADERIPLNVNMSTDGIYMLNMENITGIPQLYNIWLKDTYKKDSVDMRHNNTYSFNVLKNDSASYGSKRFYLSIRENPARAYHLLNFSAVKANISDAAHRVQISWTVENEQNYTNFMVERSIDAGKTWQTAGSATGIGIGNYGIYDNNPGINNLYRLQSQDIDNIISYSNVISIEYSGQSGTLKVNMVSVYPNPATSNINVAIADPLAQNGQYHLIIANSSGLVVKHGDNASLSWQTDVSNLLPGTYIIKVFSSKDQSKIGNAKFIKL